MRTDDEAIAMLVAALAAELKRCGRVLGTAESCTGGWIAKACTDLAGSSAWFAGGLVTYTDQAKQACLGVRAATLARFGAVSEAVAAEMVEGVCERLGADFGVAVSGIAGPGGGSVDKPVGTVCFAWRDEQGQVESVTERFEGDREAVRRASVVSALNGLLARVI